MMLTIGGFTSWDFHSQDGRTVPRRNMDGMNRKAMSLSRAKGQLKRVLKKLLFPRRHPPPQTIPRKQDEWSIGIYIGESPFDFASPENVSNPVLTRADISDVRAALVADPFMLRTHHTWHIFFEVMNQRTRKGEIGLASSDNAVQWTYQRIVLAEPFHLSYPYVFEWMGDYYMVPESFKARSVRLYKAMQFPTHWSPVATLLSGGIFLDPSIFRYHDTWWMFTETNPHRKYDTLRLYYADDLAGPWHEHRQSPIIEGNPHLARPGGRVLVLNDRVIRYAQDCYPVYGTQVRAFEVTELTRRHYHEQPVCEQAIVAASGVEWNACGMHHIDPHLLDDGRWIACVDGFVWRDS
jgi:hypothetical protein